MKYCLLSLFLYFALTGIALAQGQIIATYAGNGYDNLTGLGGYGGDGGLSINAKLAVPRGIALDTKGNLYIADVRNNRIRMVSPKGIITTIAGNGRYAPDSGAFYGDGGPATDAELYWPNGVAADSSGNIYISDGHNNRIRKVDVHGIITTIAGNGIAGYSGDGYKATTAEINNLIAITVDRNGNVYIADWGNNRVRMINPAGNIYLFAGSASGGFGGDGGPATSAKLNNPLGIATDISGNLYIADGYNNRIRMVDKNGIITTVAGNGYLGGGYGGFSGDGGPATDAEIFEPIGLGLDSNGTVYFSDFGNDRIRKFNPAEGGIITTIAGNGVWNFAGDWGPATNAEFNDPTGIAVNNQGVVYVADGDNQRIRKIFNNHPPHFINKGGFVLNTCINSLMSLDSVLEVIDSYIFQPEIWSVIKAPIHGDLNGFSDTGISTGDTLLPQGLTYTPNIGFTGFDSFGIIIFDGFDSDELTVYVSIKPPSFVTSSLVTPLTCFGDSSGSIAISVTGSGTFYYHWSNGDSLASISQLEAGTYTLNLIQASTQCKLFDTFLITQPDSIHAVAMTGNDFCHSGLGFININVSGGVAPYKYAWSTGALTNDLNGLGAGIYFLTVTDNSLCKKNLSVYLNDTCNEIIVHDVITPNGDGINDTWVIENIQVYPGNSVQVFDKWGDLVFGKNGYTNDWGGISKTGDFLPDGTYYYLVKLNAPNTGKGGNVFSGSLLIKR